MGRIFRRRSIWWIAYYHRGKEHRESSGSERESDAKKILKTRLGQIGRGKFIGPAEERVTFEELAEGLITDYKINGKRSRASALLSISHLKKCFAFDRAVDITTDRIKIYIEKRQQEILELHQRRIANKLNIVQQLRQRAKRELAIDKKQHLLAEANWAQQEAEALNTVSNASINRELAALKRMFVLAMQAGKLSTRPYIPMLEENNAARLLGSCQFRRGQFTVAE